MPSRIIDSHIHLWSPNVQQFPRAPGAMAVPAHLETPGTIEEMHTIMIDSGITGALVVQPVNYGQDYSYMEEAARLHPGFFKGMLVADPTSEDPVGAMRSIVARNPKFWVGVRFNPYKWPDVSSMAGDVGLALFAAAGKLGLPVGFMPFKGLSEHVDDIELLMQASPSTQVVIDHWGFFVQPATGQGKDRLEVQQSWDHLLRLGRQYPQVHVKLSATFRNSLGKLPFKSLEPRFVELLDTFSARRLIWGTDAPYFFDHGSYAETLAIQQWPHWQSLSESDCAEILYGTAERLFGAWPQASTGVEL